MRVATRHGAPQPTWWQLSGTRAIATFVLVAIAAPWLAPFDPDTPLDLIALASRPPSWTHPFGTDPYARDVLSRTLHGARVTVLIALSAALVSTVIGTMYGALAGFARPWVRTLCDRALDVALALPRVLVVLAMTAVLGPLPPVALALLIGCTGWFTTARQITDAVASLRRREFTMAADALGVPWTRVVRVHLLPHLLPVLAVSTTFGVANAIALEAGLSFLGLGLQPPAASWGAIMHDGAGMIATHWWLTVFPGAATALTVLTANHVGDLLRDHFAPEHVLGRDTLITPRADTA